MRRLIVFAAAVSALAVLGCGDSGATQLTLSKTDTNVTGTFNLVTAGGLSLPVFGFFDNAANEWDLLGEKIVISGSPNVWVDSSAYQITAISSGVAHDTLLVSGGSWQITSGQLNFFATGQTTTPVFAGAVIGSALTIVFNNEPFVYTR